MTHFLDACYHAITKQATSIADTITAAKANDLRFLSCRRFVLLLGCGDSYAVADYGKWALLMLGLNAISISPPELRRITIGSNCAVIGVSASGRSLVTIKALEFAKALGATTVALTDNPAGEAAQAAEAVWRTRSGVDSYDISPSAPTTAAMAYLLTLAAQIPSPTQDELRHDCEILESRGKQIVQWAETQGIAISKLVKRGSLLYLISDGPNYVAAQIGMMKLNEFSIAKGLATVREEFQHHYNLSIGKDERAVFVLDDPVSLEDESFSKIVERKLDMRTYILHTDTLDLVTPLAQAIPNTIALQMASYHVVQRYDPSKSSFKQPHADAFRIY